MKISDNVLGCLWATALPQRCKCSITDPFVRYDVKSVEKKLISMLTETRSYFDNNMENTAAYWLDMYRRQFREAGGGEGRVILPATKEIFDPKTLMFDAKVIV